MAIVIVINVLGEPIAGAEVVSTQNGRILGQAVSNSAGQAAVIVFDGSDVSAYFASSNSLASATYTPVSPGDQFNLLVPGTPTASGLPTRIIVRGATAGDLVTAGAGTCDASGTSGSGTTILSVVFGPECFSNTGTLSAYAAESRDSGAPVAWGQSLDLNAGANNVVITLSSAAFTPLPVLVTGLPDPPTGGASGFASLSRRGVALSPPWSIPLQLTSGNLAATASLPADSSADGVLASATWPEGGALRNISTLGSSGNLDASALPVAPLSLYATTQGLPGVGWSDPVQIDVVLAVVSVAWTDSRGSSHRWTCFTNGDLGNGAVGLEAPTIPESLSAFLMESAVPGSVATTLEVIDGSFLPSYLDAASFWVGPFPERYTSSSTVLGPAL